MAQLPKIWTLVDFTNGKINPNIGDRLRDSTGNIEIPVSLLTEYVHQLVCKVDNKTQPYTRTMFGDFKWDINQWTYGLKEMKVAEPFMNTANPLEVIFFIDNDSYLVITGNANATISIEHRGGVTSNEFYKKFNQVIRSAYTYSIGKQLREVFHNREEGSWVDNLPKVTLSSQLPLTDIGSLGRLKLKQFTPRLVMETYKNRLLMTPKTNWYQLMSPGNDVRVYVHISGHYIATTARVGDDVLFNFYCTDVGRSGVIPMDIEEAAMIENYRRFAEADVMETHQSQMNDEQRDRLYCRIHNVEGSCCGGERPVEHEPAPQRAFSSLDREVLESLLGRVQAALTSLTDEQLEECPGAMLMLQEPLARLVLETQAIEDRVSAKWRFEQERQRRLAHQLDHEDIMDIHESFSINMRHDPRARHCNERGRLRYRLDEPTDFRQRRPMRHR